MPPCPATTPSAGLGPLNRPDALPVPPDDARRIIDKAIPRPVTPVYTELSGELQIHLHRALTDQERPDEALALAAGQLRAILNRAGLDGARH